jgi:hypothetical protein
MQKLLTSVFLVLMLVSCSKEESKLELYNPEAFAYLIDNGWELNASTRVKGFLQNESDGTYSAKLSYVVDLITAEGDTLNEADSGLIDKTAGEKMNDLGIEVQMEIDSSFAEGKYKILFHVYDDYSESQANISKEFKLSRK